MADVIDIRIWYGGMFDVSTTRVRYVGGDQKLLRLDIDHLSYFELVDYFVEYGKYESKDLFLYCFLPGNRGLKRLVSDSDVIEMGNSRLDPDEIVDVYVQKEPVTKSKPQATSSLVNTEPNTPQTQPNTPQAQPNAPQAQPNTPQAQPKITQAQPIDLTFSPESEDESIEGGEEDLISTDRDEAGSERDDDEWRQSQANIKKVSREESESHTKVLQLCLEGGDQDHRAGRLEAHSSYEDSEGDVKTPGESEDDDILGKKHGGDAPVVSDHTDWKKWVWVVGTRFPTRDSFKEAVKKYAVANGKNLKVDVSDKGRLGRVGISCVKGCPFKLYCSFNAKKKSYMLKKVHNKHTCQRNMRKNRQLTAQFIADDFLPMFRAKPDWPAKEIQLAVKQKYKQLISKWLAYKAKVRAHNKLYGSMKEHYNKIGSYLEALRIANPTSTFELITAPPGFMNEEASSSNEHETFFRIFVCFDGLKKGFLAGCRKVICLDGCFLKTFLGGMLMAAIGRDANDQMYPVAWAVVEGENNESWEWFMQELRKVLEVTDGGKGWTLISDQQKGLVNGVANIWPEAEHRNCARHIYANWHKKHKGDELKEVFWKACRAYCEPEYKEALIEMKNLSAVAHDDFLAQNPRCFSRCYVNTHTTCDVIVNNMAETFNGYIIQSRSKHIIHMLEDIRVALMTRMITMRNKLANEDVLVCPKIQVKLDNEKKWAYTCEVYPSSHKVFQVRELEDVSVDLRRKTCSCRKWDLTGIPCKHACAVAAFLNHNAEEYVSDCYHKEQYMKSYAYTIPPLPSEKYWPTVDSPLNPPPIKAQPGRPKKKRKRDPHENPKKPGKLTRHGSEMRCSNCNEVGHNKRGCKKAKRSTSEASGSKKSRGRPKKARVGPSQASQVTQEQSQQATQQSRVGGSQKSRKKPMGRGKAK